MGFRTKRTLLLSICFLSILFLGGWIFLGSSDRTVLAEDENYVVSMQESRHNAWTREGRLFIFDKQQNKELSVKGNFSIFGGVGIVPTEREDFFVLSTGTSKSRGIIVIALESQRQAVPLFCARNKIYFWRDYVIYRDCDDTFFRPWETGSSNIVKQDLRTGKVDVLLAADDFSHNEILKIENDTLFYERIIVESAEEWSYADLHQSTPTTQTIDLSFAD